MAFSSVRSLAGRECTQRYKSGFCGVPGKGVPFRSVPLERNAERNAPKIRLNFGTPFCVSFRSMERNAERNAPKILLNFGTPFSVPFRSTERNGGVWGLGRWNRVERRWNGMERRNGPRSVPVERNGTGVSAAPDGTERKRGGPEINGNLFPCDCRLGFLLYPFYLWKIRTNGTAWNGRPLEYF